MEIIVITTDDNVKVVKADEDLYIQLKAIIKGYLEMVRPSGLPDPYVLICDEEGKCKDLKPNHIASILYGGHMVGTCVICKMGYEDWAALDKEDVAGLNRLLDVVAQIGGVR